MIYEWKCKKCGEHVDITRSIEDSNVAPDGTRDGKQVIIGAVTVDYAVEGGCDAMVSPHEWVKVYSGKVPFETLRDNGTFERTGNPR